MRDRRPEVLSRCGVHVSPHRAASGLRPFHRKSQTGASAHNRVIRAATPTRRRQQPQSSSEPLPAVGRMSADNRRLPPTQGRRGKETFVKAIVYGLLLAALLAALGAVAVTRGGSPQAATASSHREAPLISQDPTADNTDLYAFVSPDKPDTATIISNWIPGEDPAA